MSRKEKTAEEGVKEEGFIISLSHLCSISRDGPDSRCSATLGFRHASQEGLQGLRLGLLEPGIE